MALTVIMSALGSGCAKKDSGEAAALSIFDIYTDPYAFTGELTLTGIAGPFFEEDPLVLELYYTDAVLGKDACCLIMFPTKFSNDLPKPVLGDEINVSGSFIKYDVDMGYGFVYDIVFEVKEIKVIRNVMHLIS